MLVSYGLDLSSGVCFFKASLPKKKKAVSVSVTQGSTAIKDDRGLRLPRSDVTSTKRVVRKRGSGLERRHVVVVGREDSFCRNCAVPRCRTGRRIKPAGRIFPFENGDGCCGGKHAYGPDDRAKFYSRSYGGCSCTAPALS